MLSGQISVGRTQRTLTLAVTLPCRESDSYQIGRAIKAP